MKNIGSLRDDRKKLLRGLKLRLIRLTSQKSAVVKLQSWPIGSLCGIHVDLVHVGLSVGATHHNSLHLVDLLRSS